MNTNFCLPAIHCLQPHPEPNFLKIVFICYLYLFCTCINPFNHGNYKKCFKKKEKYLKLPKGGKSIKNKGPIRCCSSWIISQTDKWLFITAQWMSVVNISTFPNILKTFSSSHLYLVQGIYEIKRQLTQPSNQLNQSQLFELLINLL